MTYEQLNKHIKYYIEKVKTRSAIMLTGVWGSGKSYYIKYSLIPYLKVFHIDCVVISLYGINDLNDISKAIYMELRSIKLFKSNEATETAKIVGKTVLKNIAQFVSILNVNTEISGDDLKQLYESVDLTGKLIIFEDIERSQVDIIEFLGYVNNLVEQDGVKVLLVANESDILNKDLPIDLRNSFEKQENLQTQYFKNIMGLKDEETEASEKNLISENTKRYILVKEKTISDTINFNCNYPQAIRNIISMFENSKLLAYLNNNDVDEISYIIKNNTGNLRTFLFACQKTVDILEKAETNSDEVARCIFFSTIYFSIRYKNNNDIKWDGNKDFSLTLGNKNYPLFKCCYEYITKHYINVDETVKLNEYYKNFKQFSADENFNDNVNILYHYWDKRDRELINAIKCIETSLQSNDISFNTYGKLARYLVFVSETLEIDISDLKELLIKNLKGMASDIDTHSLFIYDQMDIGLPASNQYIELKEKMLVSLNHTEDRNYTNYYQSLTMNINNYSAKEIGELRRAYPAIYDAKLDENSEKLKELIQQLKATELNWTGERMAKIILSYFISDLERMLHKVKV